MTILISKYPGTCLTCGEPYAAGQRIDWTKGIKGAHHARCTDDGKAEAAAIAQSRMTDLADPADFNVPIGEGYSYLPYQRAGITFALPRAGTLFGDEMGLGKTLQAIGVINGDPEIRSVLVICPKSLGLNWGIEFKKFLARRATIILSIEGTRTLATGGDLRITIVNYDVVAKRIDSLLRDWDLVIFDEAHYCKNAKAKRTEAVKKIVKGAKRRLALTGTPIPNKPLELWPILQMVDPESWDPAGPKKKGGPVVPAGEGAGFMRFVFRFCNAHRSQFGRGWDFSGASRLDELQDKLRATCVPGNTLVETEYGPVAIRELVRRDIRCRVWSADALGRISLQAIECVRKTQNRKVLVQVEHSAGAFRCTPDHRIFTARGYVRADELEAGDHLCLLQQTRSEANDDEQATARFGMVLLPAVRRAGRTGKKEGRCSEKDRGSAKVVGEDLHRVLRAVPRVERRELREEEAVLLASVPRKVAIQDAADSPYALRGCCGKALANGQTTRAHNTAGTSRWLSAVGGVLREAIGGSTQAVGCASRGGEVAPWAAAPVPTRQSTKTARSRAQCLGPGLGRRGGDARFSRARWDGDDVSRHTSSGKPSDRDRWPRSLLAEGASHGQGARREAAGARVLCVARVEVGRRGEDGFRAGSGASVYDIQVARNHNFFANGVLVHNCMVRRLKKDVLLDLPPKRRQIIELPGGEDVVNEERSAFAAYEGMLEELQGDLELARAGSEDEYQGAVAKLQKSMAANFTEMSRIRAMTAVAKLPQVIEHVKEAFEESQKIVLFGHHHAVIEGLRDALAEFSPVVVYGPTKSSERQAAVERFQKDPACRLFIGGIIPAGTGITLTASSHVIFAELDWVPGNVSQAEDRTHRIGQRESVLVQHLVLEGSIDARMARILVAKQDIADRALDRERQEEPIPSKLLAEPVTMAQAGTAGEPSELDRWAAAMTAERAELIHSALRQLAGMCDKASALDGAGFSRIDVRVGHSLAGAQRLSPRQAALGARLVRKYRRQLGDLAERCMQGDP